MHDVVLRDVAELEAEAVVALIEIVAVKEDVAVGGSGVAVEGFQERCFSGAGGAHDSGHFAGEEGERDGVEEAVGANVDGEGDGFDGDVGGVLAAGEGAGVLKGEAEGAEA